MKPRVYFTEIHSRLSSLESFCIMWAWFAYKHMSGPFLHLIFKTSLGSIFYIVWLIVGITENHLVNIHSYWMSTMCQVLASWASWNIHSMNGWLTNEGHMNLTWVSISMADYQWEIGINKLYDFNESMVYAVPHKEMINSLWQRPILENGITGPINMSSCRCRRISVAKT